MTKIAGPKERIRQVLSSLPDPYTTDVDLSEKSDDKMTWHEKKQAEFRNKKEAQNKEFPIEKGDTNLSQDIANGNERV